MAGVTVVGSFNVDHVWQCDTLPAPGQTLGGRYLSGPGGKGFNQAVAARRSGAATRFICALGDDAGAHQARQLAAADSIVLEAFQTRSPTGTAGIFVDAQGCNSIVIGPGANAELDADTVAAHCRTAPGKVVLVQLETPATCAMAALHAARERGGIGLLNPAPANAETSAELLGLADIVTPNETEFVALLQRHAQTPCPADAVVGTDDATLHAWCRRVQAHATFVITLGAAGCFVSHPELPARHRGDSTAHYRLPAPEVQVIDTTGAGDAFNGALAAALLLQGHRPFRDCVAAAVRYAARSTEQAGAALAMPHLPVEFTDVPAV